MSEFATEGTYLGRVINWACGFTKDPTKLKDGEKAGINLNCELEITHRWDRRNKEYIELDTNLFSNARLCILTKEGKPNEKLLDSLNEAFGMKIDPKTVAAADMKEISGITVTCAVKDTSQEGNKPYFQTTWISVQGDGPAGIQEAAAPVLDYMQSMFEGKAKFDAKKVPAVKVEEEV